MSMSFTSKNAQVICILVLLHAYLCAPAYMYAQLWHTCQVLGNSKSEIACAPLIFAYNLVIKCAEKSGAQVLRVRFFSLLKQT